MVRGKKIFTLGSIVSIIIMVVTLVHGYFVKEVYHHYAYLEEVWHSYADVYWDSYITFLIPAILYISFGIVAIALYEKRIKAINVLHLIATAIVLFLTFGFYYFDVVSARGAYVFADSLLVALCVGLPFQLAVDIVALATLRFKKVEQPDSVVPVVTEKISTNNDAVDALTQLKELYDKGILTEEEYIAKRQPYVNKLYAEEKNNVQPQNKDADHQAKEEAECKAAEQARREDKEQELLKPTLADDGFVDVICPNCKEELAFLAETINAVCPNCNEKISLE